MYIFQSNKEQFSIAWSDNNFTYRSSQQLVFTVSSRFVFFKDF